MYRTPPLLRGAHTRVSLLPARAVQAVPENKRRPAEFRGLCIARRNRGLGSSFRLRSVLNNFAVERSFPLCAP